MRTLRWTTTKQAHPAWLQERLNARCTERKLERQKPSSIRNQRKPENEELAEKLQNNVSVTQQQPWSPSPGGIAVLHKVL